MFSHQRHTGYMEIVLEVCFGVFLPPPPLFPVSELLGADQRSLEHEPIYYIGNEMKIKFRLN